MEPTSPIQHQEQYEQEHQQLCSFSSAIPSYYDVASNIQKLKHHGYTNDEISFIIANQNPRDQITYIEPLIRKRKIEPDTHYYQRLLHQEVRDSSEATILYNFADPDSHITNLYIPIDTKSRVPSLQELTLKLLDKHSYPVALLAGVSNEQKQRLSNLLCSSGEMNGRFLELLLCGFPTHIQLRDCSCLTKLEFLKYFRTLVTSELEVLQLDKCGSIITDETVYETLAKPRNSLSKLTSLSIAGAYNLNNEGLELLVSSVTALRYINLTKCVRLTATGLHILADSFGSTLKEVYIDGFNLINTKGILQALKRLKQLQVLSLAGIRDLSDEFIKDYVMACGRNLKGLVLKDCVNLTDVSMRFIADFSRRLNVLDISNMCKLTDSSLGYFNNRFRQLSTLKLGRNQFSDEAIAVFLEIAGKTLEELSLNSIDKVGRLTVMSLARNGKNLHTLDLSHCRNLRDRDLALIVNRCLSLRTLKLVGCSQVNNSNKGVSSDQFDLVMKRYINTISSSPCAKKLADLLDKILSTIYSFFS